MQQRHAGLNQLSPMSSQFALGARHHSQIFEHCVAWATVAGKAESSYAAKLLGTSVDPIATVRNAELAPSRYKNLWRRAP